MIGRDNKKSNTPNKKREKNSNFAAKTAKETHGVCWGQFMPSVMPRRI